MDTDAIGSVTALVQIELLPGDTLKLSGTDLRDYYFATK